MESELPWQEPNPDELLPVLTEVETDSPERSRREVPRRAWPWRPPVRLTVPIPLRHLLGRVLDARR